MKKLNLIKYFICTGALMFSMASCTDLEEQVLEGAQNGDAESYLAGAYKGLRSLQGQGQTFAMGEVASDTYVVPTRGGDWGDGGAWRNFHALTWDANSGEINGAWNNLLSSVYYCDLVLQLGTVSAEKKAEALFLKAFYYHIVLDYWGKAPYREAGADINDFPKVWNGVQATTNIIAWLEEALPNLPAKVANKPHLANKDAANFLLAKMYLNKAVFTDSDRQAPFTFSTADMNKVIAHVDAITNSSIAADIWDNYKPNNHASPEVIFTSQNIQGQAMGDLRTRWYMSHHYNQTPGGWNGFSMVSEFYNRFSPNDRRVLNADPAIIANFGNPVGVEKGQQYKPGGVEKVKDRNGVDLVFTPNIDTDLILDTNIENAGYRPMRYIPDANVDKPENDYILMLYSDAVLMKAEAILRGGTGTNNTAAISAMESRCAPATVTFDLSTLNGIYKERGRELWGNGFRRTDMIRFGTFLNARELKTTVSNPKYLLYPVPASALANPNISQNPGY
ncbi:RagB/SusD family nutrient uptake outer membrane protein [Flavobacterium branchiophilum]|uniref:RagB/SusD family nutrient uptake outer membrane protein n=2 Tax=Flavobacterium branchiophilum TaxID=55197 RepID=A0A2H3KQX1_9FLAO|nr:RagB/SusD family nutrient uptake outer membrane protein [Flavobacterium branchiophilum]PDS24217.1 RagB/SusD family nutrient uptake outer membrane protein [Flavobacterium branchiophilum]CCB68655.1 Probable lipoprotein precursor, SusD/RagB family [Flavobacterium branchiophilum FL-15]